MPAIRIEIENEKQSDCVIDCTPKWRDLLHDYIQRANEGNQDCVKELERMADIADKFSELQKFANNLKAGLEYAKLHLDECAVKTMETIAYGSSIKINYVVSKNKGTVRLPLFEHVTGQIEKIGEWIKEDFQQEVRDTIRAMHPGYSLSCYAEAEKYPDILKALLEKQNS